MRSLGSWPDAIGSMARKSAVPSLRSEFERWKANKHVCQPPVQFILQDLKSHFISRFFPRLQVYSLYKGALKLLMKDFYPKNGS